MFDTRLGSPVSTRPSRRPRTSAGWMSASFCSMRAGSWTASARSGRGSRKAASAEASAVAVC